VTRDRVEGRALDDRPEAGGGTRVFPLPGPTSPLDATRWSQIGHLGQRGTTPEQQRAWADAWAYLFTTFRPALENQVRRVLRRNGFPADECEDVVQEFWAQCLEKDWLTKADRRIGRFRTFARVVVRRFTSKHVAARRALRRAPPLPRVSLTGMEDSVPARASDAGFHADWDRCRMDEAIRRVAQRSPRNAAWLRARLDAEEAAASSRPAPAGEVDTSDAVVRSRARRMLAEELEWLAGEE
jgi:hypothetical protein